MDPDEFHGQGGTYEVREGKRVLVTPPTQPHPDGDRPREADGKPADQGATDGRRGVTGRADETSSDN